MTNGKRRPCDCPWDGATSDREPDIQVVGEAADGDQAVQAARRLRPDAVLMDARLPNPDGVQAAEVAGRRG